MNIDGIIQGFHEAALFVKTMLTRVTTTTKMVKVYFDIYGPDFNSLSLRNIDDKHVTNVGEVYSFYCSHVPNPKIDYQVHSMTKHVVKCSNCEWKFEFSRSSSGQSGGVKNVTRMHMDHGG